VANLGAAECPSGQVFVGTGCVTPRAPSTVSISVLADKTVELDWTGTPGVQYDLQASTDLTTWVTIGSTVADTQGHCRYIDNDASGYQTRLYRAAVAVTP
jgi:hypothetical protein